MIKYELCWCLCHRFFVGSIFCKHIGLYCNLDCGFLELSDNNLYTGKATSQRCETLTVAQGVTKLMLRILFSLFVLFSYPFEIETLIKLKFYLSIPCFGNL